MLSMIRVALCGLFDLPNCIDRMGITVFSNELRKRNVECSIDLYAFEEAAIDIDGFERIEPVTELEANHLKNAYDVLVITGEDVISFKNREIVCGGDEDGVKNYYPSYIWTIPTMISKKYGIKLIWNAPSVSADFNDDMLAALSDAIKNTDYISTNNYLSFANILDMGFEDYGVRYVPDNLVLISRYYHKERLAGIGKSICGDGEYIVVNINKNLPDELTASISEKIKETSENVKIALLPLYNSEGEDKYLSEFAEGFGDNVIAAGPDLTIEQFLSVVSESSRVITQNTALAACAYSFGVQAYIYDFENVLCDLNEDLTAVCDGHFDEIVKCMNESAKKRSESMINGLAKNVQNVCYKKMCADMKNEIKALRDCMELYKAKAEDFERELHSTQENLKYFKTSYENILEQYDKDMEEKNNSISKLNRKMYEIENSKAYRIANKFIKE